MTRNEARTVVVIATIPLLAVLLAVPVVGRLAEKRRQTEALPRLRRIGWSAEAAGEHTGQGEESAGEHGRPRRYQRLQGGQPSR